MKSKQQATWSAGDYAVIGTTLQITGELLCEAVDVAAGERVLDVAAGNGNASLAAARRGGVVTATDDVGALLDGTAARAPAEGSVDLALPTFGATFTPNDLLALAEANNTATNGTLRVPSDYLETTIRKD